MFVCLYVCVHSLALDQSQAIPSFSTCDVEKTRSGLKISTRLCVHVYFVGRCVYTHVYMHVYACICHKDTPPKFHMFIVFCCFAVSGGMAGGGGAGGWGFAGMQQQPMVPRNPQQPNYEAMFNSLFPMNGMVTGMYMCTYMRKFSPISLPTLIGENFITLPLYPLLMIAWRTW